MWYRKKENLPTVNPVLRYILFVFTGIFWLIGLALILVGVYACVEKEIIIDDFSSLVTDPALIILSFGAGLFFISFFACVGTLRENICMLKFFSIVLSLSLFIQLVSGFLIVLLSDHVEKSVKEYFLLMIKTYRDDPDRQNIIDWGQEEFECCGAYDYRDWEWNIYFNCTPSNPSFEKCSVPWSCCRIGNSTDVVNTLCGIGVLELDFVDAGKLINPVGCIPTLINWLHEHIFILACMAFALIVPQIMGILFSRILLLQIKDQVLYMEVNGLAEARPIPNRTFTPSQIRPNRRRNLY